MVGETWHGAPQRQTSQEAIAAEEEAEAAAGSPVRPRGMLQNEQLAAGGGLGGRTPHPHEGDPRVHLDGGGDGAERDSRKSSGWWACEKDPVWLCINYLVFTGLEGRSKAESFNCIQMVCSAGRMFSVFTCLCVCARVWCVALEWGGQD